MFIFLLYYFSTQKVEHMKIPEAETKKILYEAGKRLVAAIAKEVKTEERDDFIRDMERSGYPEELVRKMFIN